jgi:hypothetical protein
MFVAHPVKAMDAQLGELGDSERSAIFPPASLRYAHGVTSGGK